MNVGVIVFPGSNCDHDAYHVVRHVLGLNARFIWHKETELGDVDLVIVPGGFSYGDYLRAGAVARFSPIMERIVTFAHGGGLVLGICNGFQVLCEAGLLPGALLRNASLRFVCKWVYLRVESSDTAFTNALRRGQVIRVPIAHGEGSYFASADTLDALEAEERVVFRYCDEKGTPSQGANPNGSARHIAGIINLEGNVLGMMPHPERCAESEVGGADGLLIFRSLMAHSMRQLAIPVE